MNVKLYEYQNKSKMWFANNKLSLTGRWKCYFWTFFFFIFPNFKRLFSRMLLKNYEFMNRYHNNGFQRLLWSSTSWQIFLVYKFSTIKSRSFLHFFEIYMEMHFVSLFFSKWKKYCNLHLKCSIAHYAKTLLNRKICFFVFSFLIMFILTRLLSKTLWKNYHLLTQISSSCFKM